MDREKQDQLPALQLGWIDGICLPLFKVCTSMILYDYYRNLYFLYVYLDVLFDVLNDKH